MEKEKIVIHGKDYSVFPHRYITYYVDMGDWFKPPIFVMNNKDYEFEIKDRTAIYEFPKIVDRIITNINIESNVINEYIKCKALWDTGATTSGLSQDLINRIGLSPIKRGITSNGVSGKFSTDVYRISISINDFWSCGGIQAIRYDLDDCDLIIGMDVISQGDFAVKNVNGKTVMTFRYPPQGK